CLTPLGSFTRTAGCSVFRRSATRSCRDCGVSHVCTHICETSVGANSLASDGRGLRRVARLAVRLNLQSLGEQELQLLSLELIFAFVQRQDERQRERQ